MAHGGKEQDYRRRDVERLAADLYAKVAGTLQAAQKKPESLADDCLAKAQAFYDRLDQRQTQAEAPQSKE